MAMPFARTMRSLENDSSRRGRFLLLLLLLLLGGWAIWLGWTRVPIYAISSQARLELAGALYPLEATVTDTVVATDLQLGQRVAVGDLLVQLDARAEETQLAAKQAHLQTLSQELLAVQDAITLETEEFDDAQAVAQAAIDAAQARFERATTRAPQPDDSVLTTDALASAYAQLDFGQRSSSSTWRIQLAELQRLALRLEGAISTTKAEIDELTQAVQHRQIQAATSGQIIESVELQPGQLVQAGRHLGTILADTSQATIATKDNPTALRIVAQVEPRIALGRVTSGQQAQMYLDGFPWQQFGTLQATVESVASEVRDGQIRVELAVLDNQETSIPMQHGLPGRVEIEVEQLSPIALLLQAIGERVVP